MTRAFTFWSTCILLMSTLLAHGQIKFTAKANKYVVGENENFVIEFKINERGSNFQAPDLSNFLVLSGPNPSQQSSYSNVSGRSFSLAYSYQLRPRQKGKFTIGSASIKAAGDTYRSKPIEIEVVAQAARPKNPNDPQSIAEANTFFKILTSKRTLYKGEPLVVSYKLYTKLDVGNPFTQQTPDLNGFYREQIELSNIRLQSERYENENFSAGVFNRYLLIPQKAGRLSPGRVEISIPVAVETGRRDVFGFRRRQQVNHVMVDNFPAITVKPLPEKGKPSNFSGAVGDYKFEVKCSKTELRADESITFSVEIKGSGNVKLASLPEVEFPDAFEAYDPKYEENVRVGLNGMRGSKRNEYLLVPRYGGTYKIPALEFSFFNVNKGRYETIKSKPFEIEVEGGATRPAGGNIAAVDKEGVRFLGKEILTIKKELSLQKQKTSFFGSGLFYALLVIGLGLLIVLIAVGIYLRNRTVDYKAERQNKASKKARRYLALAKKELDAQQSDRFYEALGHALWGYFGDKLDIPQSQMSKENIANHLASKGIAQTEIEQVLGVLNQAEIARYASTSNLRPLADYEATALLITKIDAQL